jgi:hypothetical protein
MKNLALTSIISNFQQSSQLGLNTRILSAYMIVLAHKVQKEPLPPLQIYSRALFHQN